MRMMVLTCTATAGLVAGTALGDEVLFDNGPPDGSNGYSNATADVLGARRTVLDDFLLDGEYEVTDLHWEHIWDTGPVGSGRSAEITFRQDAGGAPGAPIATAVITSYSETDTGVTYFSRPGAVSWVTFEPIALSPGVYWIDATIVGPENNFWLIRPNDNGSECWVNYEDLGGFIPGSEQFGVTADLNFIVTGRPADPCADCPCPEDVNHDDIVDFADILKILAAWGPCAEDCDDCEDGTVERCGGSDECLQCQTPDGDCLCTFGAQLGCGDFVICDDGRCPSGFFCCVNTCCANPICMPLCDVGAPEFEPAEPGELTPSGIARASIPTFDLGAVSEMGPQRRGDLDGPAGPHDIVGRRAVVSSTEVEDTDRVAADPELARTYGHTGRAAPERGDTTQIGPNGHGIATVQIGVGGFSGSENVITFDELGGVVPDTGPFSIGDVTFSEASSGSGGPGWRLLEFDFPGPPTPQILTDNAGISDIRIDFALPQDRAGVYVGVGPATFEMQAYDQGGNFLESAQVTVAGDEDGAFLGFENVVGISRLRVIEISGENSRVGGIDDVHYERLPRDEKWCNGPYNCETDTCWFSNRNSDLSPFIRYDDFVCPEDSLVGTFEFIAGGWQGAGPCDLLSNLAAVEIAIYEWRPDDLCGWVPGARICTNVVPVEAMDIERHCIDQFGIQQYRFSGLLPEPCDLPAGAYAISIAGVLRDREGCFMCWAATSQPRRCLGYGIDRNTGEGCADGPSDTFFCLDTVDPCDFCPCPEDVNRDGVVDFADILKVLAAWGPCPDENACDTPGVCGEFTVCGTGEPFDCFCWTTSDGEGVCYQNFLCDSTEDCVDGRCPPGFVCVVDSCCDVPKCVPMIKCDEPAVWPEGASGLTGSGAFIELRAPEFDAPRPAVKPNAALAPTNLK